jgi:hypothetical protein
MDRVDEGLPVTWKPTRARLSWGGTIAGAVVVLALFDLLLFLGAAVGLSAASTAGWEGGKVGAGAGIATAIFIALATFFGAHVGVSLSSLRGKSEAVLQGLVTWALSFQSMAIYLTFIATLGAGAASSLAGNALGQAAAAGAIPTAPPAVTPEQQQQAQATSAAASWWLFAAAVLGAAGGMLGGMSAWPAREEEAGVPQRPRGERVTPPGREVTP